MNSLNLIHLIVEWGIIPTLKFYFGYSINLPLTNSYLAILSLIFASKWIIHSLIQLILFRKLNFTLLFTSIIFIYLLLILATNLPFPFHLIFLPNLNFFLIHLKSLSTIINLVNSIHLLIDRIKIKLIYTSFQNFRHLLSIYFIFLQVLLFSHLLFLILITVNFIINLISLFILNFFFLLLEMIYFVT